MIPLIFLFPSIIECVISMHRLQCEIVNVLLLRVWSNGELSPRKYLECRLKPQIGRDIDWKKSARRLVSGERSGNIRWLICRIRKSSAMDKALGPHLGLVVTNHCQPIVGRVSFCPVETTQKLHWVRVLATNHFSRPRSSQDSTIAGPLPPRTSKRRDPA